MSKTEMAFTITEEFSCGKSMTGYTEDRLVKNDHLFGVLDGSRGPDVQGSELITSILDDAVDFLQNSSDTISLEEIIRDLTALVCGHKKQAGIDNFRLSGGFVFCLYSARLGEVWRVGDCKFRQESRTNSLFWRTEEVCAEARSIILHSWLNEGKSTDEVMADARYQGIISSLLRHEASFLNRQGDPRSFGAIIGNDVPESFIERYPATSGRLIITSDGYPKVCDTLAETEEALDGLLALDPLCISENLQCKGTGQDRHSFDDRAFIAADLSP